jgi:large subunit ribosomal protein L13
VRLWGHKAGKPLGLNEIENLGIEALMTKTTFPRKEDLQRKWYVVDAAGIPIGRVASEVARILMGKHQPFYTPHLDTGDHVIILNAGKAAFTGKKLARKAYRRHSMRPGGLKTITAEKLLERNPIRPMELAIKGMLPKTRLGRAMYRKLHVYAGDTHNHEAQRPETLEFQKKG